MKGSPRLRWANQWKELPNQSAFHEEVRQILTSDSFLKGLKCYQEVPVVDLIEDYPDYRHRFDWYIDELNTVIELHGEQHYKPVNFGGQGYEETVSLFKQNQRRDSLKKEAAENAGFNYIAISYVLRKKLNATLFKEIILR